MPNLDLHTGLSLDSYQSPRGNSTKSRWDQDSVEGGTRLEEGLCGNSKVNSPSLLGIQFSTGTLKHKSNQSNDALHSGSRKHTDAVVADRLSKPDVPFFCSWQQS